MTKREARKQILGWLAGILHHDDTMLSNMSGLTEADEERFYQAKEEIVQELLRRSGDDTPRSTASGISNQSRQTTTNEKDQNANYG